MPLRKQKSRRRIYSKESVVQTTELYLLDSVPTSSTTLDTFLKFFFLCFCFIYRYPQKNLFDKMHPLLTR